MKKSFIIIGLITLSIGLASFVFKTLSYDSRFVEITNTTYQGSKYNVVWMKKGESNNKINARYFSNQTTTQTVHERFQSWADQKKVICYSSGTYMDALKKTSSTGLIGIAVDNGNVQNESVVKNGLDALVIVYATGGIACSNLSKKNLSVKAIRNGAKLDIRGNDWHKQEFIKWAKSDKATVFQTHLLAMDTKLNVASNGSSTLAKRRFLAVVNDEDGKLVYAMIHDSNPSSLYESSNKIFKYLTDEREVSKIHWMINLDTGAQDVFGIYYPNGSRNPNINGNIPITNARNLLVFHQD